MIGRDILHNDTLYLATRIGERYNLTAMIRPICHLIVMYAPSDKRTAAEGGLN